ncbi:MAG: Myosin heavy chain [uncultured Sulfurovum sp.]|uniref:Myosin heavy chain n=1 Tax=uncultured Sulfurovum sp. TaxID=269237 RepID=A0A6S6SR71_9BACT|nr:MAG: Myosin heavy chain [uncultured Sulfurovum sp.]
MSNLSPSKELDNNLALLAQKIDTTYKEGLSIYSEALNNHTIEIEELKNQINREKKAKEQEEQQLNTTQQERKFQEQLLQKLNDTVSQKIHSINELKTQYADLIDEKEYQKILSQKESKLYLTLDEIEELEITLLEQELEYINILTKLIPKRQNIIQLEEDLKKLELKKEYYALKKLQQLPQLSLESYDEITTEIIEDNSKEEKN